MSDDDIRLAKEPGSATLQGPNPLHRILVVDDEASIRQLVTGTLANFGYRVDAAEDGADAWEALQVNRYDLLITDNNMPKVSGVELLQRLHATRIELPVIMATGTLPTEEFIRNPCLEPVTVLLKPFSIAELMVTVKAVLCAVGGSRKQIGPPSDWSSQTSTNGLQS
ncbi:MAG: response regulator transcription factor [Limisphaerales bacterium]